MALIIAEVFARASIAYLHFSPTHPTFYVMIACSLIRRVTAANPKLQRSGGIHAKAEYNQRKRSGGLSLGMEGKPDYSKWSTEKLVDRVTFLEEQLKEQTTRC